MENSLRCGLLANHGLFVLKLDTLAVLPVLVSEGLVSLDEKEIIQSKTTGGEKTDVLLTLIHRKGVFDSNVYDRFLRILGDEYLSGGQQLEKLVFKVRDDSANQEILGRFIKAAPSGLDPKQKSALRSEEEQLVSSLNVEDILADLISLGVLSLDENEVYSMYVYDQSIVCNNNTCPYIILLYVYNIVPYRIMYMIFIYSSIM